MTLPRLQDQGAGVRTALEGIATEEEKLAPTAIRDEALTKASGTPLATKATPIGADEAVIYDSAAAGGESPYKRAPVSAFALASQVEAAFTSIGSKIDEVIAEFPE